VLPAAHRLRSSESFRSAVRHGGRTGSRLLVVHLLRPESAPSEPVRVGLVVSRSVGPAVVRSRVKRRLRHLLRERLSGLPAGGVLVVRAQPSAATASSATLGRELDRLLGRVLEGAA
jgi:ribonuclease P protein component